MTQSVDLLLGILAGTRGVGSVTPTKSVVQQSPQVQGIAAINREVTPRYLDTATAGKTFTNGRGESKFGAFKPYLA